MQKALRRALSFVPKHRCVALRNLWSVALLWLAVAGTLALAPRGAGSRRSHLALLVQDTARMLQDKLNLNRYYLSTVNLGA